MLKAIKKTLTSKETRKTLQKAGSIAKTGAAVYGGYKIAEKVPVLNKVTDAINSVAGKASDVVANTASSAGNTVKSVASTATDKVKGVFTKSEAPAEETPTVVDRVKGVFTKADSDSNNS